MENYSRRLVFTTMGAFLFILSAQAETTILDPLKQVNLSPFRQWRSAWECLQNKNSTVCSTEHTIKLDGMLAINGTNLTDFCKNGCLQHTNNVLNCIKYVKRDFWFGNGATVYNISQTINDACIQNSSIYTYYKSSGTRTYQNSLVGLVAGLATVLMV